MPDPYAEDVAEELATMARLPEACPSCGAPVVWLGLPIVADGVAGVEALAYICGHRGHGCQPLDEG